MLVEINLLPEREPRKFTFVVVLSILVFLILVVSGFYFWQIQSTKSAIESKEREISVTQRVADRAATNTNTTQKTNSISQLESAIKWAKEYPIQTIPVMRELTSLLPERGFIQSLGYTEAGTVTLTVQFDSSRDAAYFLNNLSSSSWIQEANLNSLTAQSTTGTNTTATASTQTNQTNAVQANTVQSNTNAASTTDSGNTQDQTGTATTDQSNQTSAANSDNSTTTGQTVTAAPNQSQSASTNTTTVTTTTADSSNDQYLPRYIGQFEITLNKDKIKESTKKSTSDEEGVTGS